ncbi:MAG: phosphoribosyl-ATP diphosphatase [Hyphomicrobiales bacterium]|nr:phosphoribosyl-ATP diphosphatase [Hyphomicrobiales bacterium]MCA2000004.1 phosphoribosyl-ATP diphosphatase [Hyphomicrobiales bacterium]
MPPFTLADLESRIAARAQADPAESYTAKIVARGAAQAGKKLGEEAVEAVIAALQGDRTELTKEAADVLYHLLVVLHIGGVAVQDVLAELENRTLQSGIEEKARRRPD